MKQKRNIWMDCDPGIDDAVALAMASLRRDQLNICGISSVAGNQTSERVTGNALKLSVFLGMEDVPVVCGARGPLLRQMISAGDIHGKTGLGYCELPETEKALAAENGILYMRDVIAGLPGGEKMTLVPTGPLTNIALLIKTFPEVKERIEEIVLMGGASAGGNITPTAEFNIWEDPEAAAIVFASGLPIVMCGLDVTEQCGVSREQVKALANSKKTHQRAYGEMLQFYFDSPAYADRDITCVHDAVTILYLTEPELFGGRAMNVTVDCSEGVNRGMTICDKRTYDQRADRKETAFVVDQVDAKRFQELILEGLAKLDAE